MLKINFYPEHDDRALEDAASEYAEIWKQEGAKITATIESASGFKFDENIINAIVFEGKSFSHP